MFPSPPVAIVGWGMTGKATSCLFDYVDRYDVDDPYDKCHDFIIFCLPTPTKEGKQDISIIEDRLKEILKFSLDGEAPLPTIILRSTVLPGTTDKLIEKYKMDIVFVPEFLTESTAVEDALNPEFLVIGARDILARRKVAGLFYDSKIVRTKIIMCSAVTAELIKYSMNSFFALKVIMANQLWDVAKEIGANYDQVREALESHKWGSKNGWNVWHNQKRGFGGKCLPKDLEAFTDKFDLPLLETVQEINKGLIKKSK